ncbi:MAG: PilZ domain-containing protein [Deltaproteobacteria bacterium]|nr:PilZ domain-containing protein [Deltaproteobacteria bacterium]
MDSGENIMQEDAPRREYVRTNDVIPVYYEVAGSEGEAPRTAFDWEVMFDDIEPRAEDNPKLYELLFDINQKLNILLNHMSDKNGFNLPEAKEVNISGGGLRFFSNEAFESGQRLVLKTFLPVYAHVVKINCEVVRSLPQEGGGFSVAVKYVDMDETTRDKIIKYIFAKQRRILRTEKGTTD